MRYPHSEQGTFVLYRHTELGQEVQVSHYKYNNYLAVQCVTIVCQVFYRRCNLRELCHCAVAVRAGQLIVTFDICTRGYLQASIPHHCPAL